MVEISEEEFREYVDLKRKEVERQQRIEELIARGPGSVHKWTTKLNTLRGYSSLFVNVLEEERERRGKPAEFILDRWHVVKQYLPPALLCVNGKRIDLKKMFRIHLRNFGWSVKIDHKHGLFIVKKNI